MTAPTSDGIFCVSEELRCSKKGAVGFRATAHKWVDGQEITATVEALTIDDAKSKAIQALRDKL
jgi:hypothetical protein